MSDTDQQTLHKQAYDQAGNFEVLNKGDVASMSRVSPTPVVAYVFTDIMVGAPST